MKRHMWVNGLGEPVIISNANTTALAVSDMAILVGVNANTLTGDNIHFVD